MPERKYRRLTRERAALTFSVAGSSRSSLWLGEDHLLQVESAYFAENYKRFFFRDIQAITIRETHARMLFNIILGGLLFVSTLAIVTASNHTAQIIWSCIVFVFFGIPFLLNNLFGPTCACEIRTAVQTEKMPSLRRLRQARKALNKIRPLIAATQGQMTPDEVNARMRETAPAEPAAPANESPAPDGALPPMAS
ncbi:MAG TPA: hypothetical protein VN873_04575 [Candidatus Angelobacter sp.]|nr:hypothetical protein [Candidatus Angelobacter sp.]